MESNERYITKIDDHTAKRICSGQVVTSLTNVVKELVENAIDAKATVITIRLEEMGKKSIEVCDNGFGIASHNFEILGKRNCTSKLEDFEQLSSISSFGFRGEAINSLCLLADVTIQTRHATDMIGSKLEFDSTAMITKKLPMALNVGTIVTVKNLFRDTPVRRKEFHSNLKREFDKMLRLMYGYCVGCVGLRITLSNQMMNKPKQTVLSSPGISIRNNIVEVFDMKQSNCLIEFKSKAENDDNDCGDEIKISGFISKCDSGCGRSSHDRQFFYVNRRPCDMKNVQKFVNEIYRSFNKNQYPFVIMNMKIDTNSVDFNLSPDKRQLLIANEDKLFQIIKDCLTKLYNKENSCSLNSMTNYVTKDMRFSQPKRRDFQELEESVDSEISEVLCRQRSPDLPQPFVMSRVRSPCDSSFEETTSRDVITPPLISEFRTPSKSFTSAREQLNRSDSDNDEPPEPKKKKRNKSNTDPRKDSDVPKKAVFEPISPISPIVPYVIRDVPSTSNHTIISNLSDQTQTSNKNNNNNNTAQRMTTQITIASQETNESGGNTKEMPQDFEVVHEVSHQIVSGDSIIQSTQTSSAEAETFEESNDLTIDFDEQVINALFDDSIKPKVKENDHKFSAKIKCSQNQTAEEELRHELQKNSFEDMKVIGQFNLGFIITKLEKDLFIVDQHASDERYNYERLLASTAIENQKLVVPMPLELSAANENIVMDNLDFFKRLGFGLVINSTAVPGKRIHLSGIPISKDWTASKEEIEEVIGQLIETPVDVLEDYKLNGFKKVIASRACRSSVMIGEPLLGTQMKTIVNHMSRLQNPWHCAHNRPTIRHLIDLEDISSLISND